MPSSSPWRVDRSAIISDNGILWPDGATTNRKNAAIARTALGLPLYAKQEPRKFGRGTDVHTESNPLPICLRRKCW